MDVDLSVIDSVCGEFSIPSHDLRSISRDRVDETVEVRWREDAEVEHLSENRLYVSDSSPIWEGLDEVFNTITSSISVTGGSISRVSIRRVSDMSDFPEWNLYTTENCDSEWVAFVKIEYPTVDAINMETVLDSVVDSLSDEFESVSSDELVNVRYLFSDLNPVSLSTIRGTVETENPELYYTVESVEEYCEAITDEEDAYRELLSQENYSADFWIGDADSDEPPASISEPVEAAFWDMIDDTLSVEFDEYIVEGEHILYGDVGEYASEGLTYYLHIPL